MVELAFIVLFILVIVAKVIEAEKVGSSIVVSVCFCFYRLVRYQKIIFLLHQFQRILRTV